MPTSNELLLDAAIRHQVQLLRFTKGEVAKAVKLLEASDKELTALLNSGLQTEMGEARTKQLLASVRKLRAEVAGKIKGQIDETSEELAQSEATWELNAIEGTSPVVLALNTVAPSVLKAVVASPINGVPLQGWIGQMAQSEVNRMEQAIRLGVLQGETKEQIVKRVLAVSDVTKQNASTIVRTAANHVSNQAAQSVWDANADILEGVRWCATLDGRTSPVCRSRDGEVYPVDKGPRPPAHPNCRSRVVPVVRGEKVVGDRPTVRDARTRREREIDFRAEAKAKAGEKAWSGMSAAERNAATSKIRKAWTDEHVGSVPGNVNYEGWLKRQPKAFQDDVLGPARAKMFRDGMPLDKFVDESGKQYTLAELKAATAGDALNVVQPGIGLKAKAYLQQGMGTDEVLQELKNEFPDSNTSKASIASYKVELKKAGLLDPLSMTLDLPTPTALKSAQAVADIAKQFDDNLPEGLKEAVGAQWLTLVEDLQGAPGAYAHYKAGQGVTASSKKLAGISPMQAKQVLAHELGHLVHKQHQVVLSFDDIADLKAAAAGLDPDAKKLYSYYLTHLDELTAEVYAQALSPSSYTSQGILAGDFNLYFGHIIEKAKIAIAQKFPPTIKVIKTGAPGMPFEVAGKHTSIGSLAKALLQQGLSDEQVLAAVKAEFPDAKTGMNSIKSYKSELNKLKKINTQSGPTVVPTSTTQPLPQPSPPTPPPQVLAAVASPAAKTFDTGNQFVNAMLNGKPASSIKVPAAEVKKVGLVLMEVGGVLENGHLVDILKIMYPQNEVTPAAVATWKSVWKKENPLKYDAAVKLGTKLKKIVDTSGPTPGKLPKLAGTSLGLKSSQVLEGVKNLIKMKAKPDDLVTYVTGQFGGAPNIQGANDLIELAHYEIATGKAIAKPYVDSLHQYGVSTPAAPAVKVDMTPTRLASTPSEGFPPPPRFSAEQRAAGMKQFGVQPKPSLASTLNSRFGLKGDDALTPEEAGAVQAYTGGTYHSLNQPLRNGGYASNPALQAYVDAAQHGLRKLPKFTGLSSRGITIHDPTKLKATLSAYQQGTVVEEHAFVSSSKGEQAAFSGNIYMKITGKSGVDVSSFSHYSSEREVLFAPGSRFRVDSVAQENGKWVIRMTEL